MSGRYTFTNNTQTGLGTWIGWPVDVSFPVFGSTLNGTTVPCCDGDLKKTAELVAAAGKDGTRIMSEVGSIWYKFWGNSEATAVRHSCLKLFRNCREKIQGPGRLICVDSILPPMGDTSRNPPA